MKPAVKNSLILAAPITILIILDQVLKFLAETKKIMADLGIVAFHYVSNTGASFGMLQGNNTLLIWVSLIVLGVILICIDRIKKEQTIPLLLVVSGLLGNLIDRIFRGHVVDFIDLKFWPVFNLADSLIVIGVFWLIIVILRKDSAKKQGRTTRKNKDKKEKRKHKNKKDKKA